MDNRAVFVNGLPIYTTQRTIREFVCEPIEVNEKGKFGIFINPIKPNAEFKSAKIIFESHEAAVKFIESQNKKPMPGESEPLHCRFFEPRDKVDDATNVIVQGLPINLIAEDVFDYFEEESSGIAKDSMGKPRVKIVGRENGKITAEMTYSTSAEARICVLKMDGSNYRRREDHPLTVSLAKATVHKEVADKEVPLPDLNVDEAGPSKVRGCDIRSVYVSNLPQRAKVPSIYFYFSGFVTGISKYDSGVPKISLIRTNSSKVEAKIQFDTEQDALLCTRKMDGRFFEGLDEFEMKVKMFKKQKKDKPSPLLPKTGEDSDSENKEPVKATAVHISTLPVYITSQSLYEYLKSRVDGILLDNAGRPNIEILSKGCGKAAVKVSFTTTALAERCISTLNGHAYQGNKQFSLKMRIYKEPKTTYNKRIPEKETSIKHTGVAKAETDDLVEKCSLHVGGLPKGVTTEQIGDFFESRMPGVCRNTDGLYDIEILRKMGRHEFAKVSYKNKRMAEACVLLLHNSLFENMENHNMHISLFENRNRTTKKPVKGIENGRTMGASIDNISLAGSTNGKQNDAVSTNDDMTADRVLHVRNLPADVTVEEIHQFFESRCAGVEIGADGQPSISLKKAYRERATATVEYKNELCALRCIVLLNKMPFNGRKDCLLGVSIYYPGGRQNANNNNRGSTLVDTPKMIVKNVVYVDGFPRTVTEGAIIEVFEIVGQIRKVNLFKNEDGNFYGRGTVSFENYAAAERCINMFNDTNFHGNKKKMFIKQFETTQIRRSTHTNGRKMRDQGVLFGIDPEIVTTLSKHEELEKNKPKETVPPVHAYDCIVCFETWPQPEMIGCVPVNQTEVDMETHYICLECARRHAEALTTDGEVGTGGAGLPCCTDKCKRVIMWGEVNKYLDDNTVRLLEKRMTSVALMGVEGIEYCKSCDYGVIIEATTIQMQYFHCANLQCQSAFCRRCKIDLVLHTGKSCEDADPVQRQEKIRRNYEEELSAAVIRICPTCQTQFQKLDGCNKMKCGNCQLTMCYLCRATGIGYEHFQNGTCGQDRDATAYDNERLEEIHRRARETQEQGPVMTANFLNTDLLWE